MVWADSGGARVDARAVRACRVDDLCAGTHLKAEDPVSTFSRITVISLGNTQHLEIKA